MVQYFVVILFKILFIKGENLGTNPSMVSIFVQELKLCKLHEGVFGKSYQYNLESYE